MEATPAAVARGKHNILRSLLRVAGFVGVLVLAFLLLLLLNRAVYGGRSTTTLGLFTGVLVTPVVYAALVWGIPRVLKNLARGLLAGMPVPSPTQAGVGAAVVLVGVPFAYAHDFPWASFWHGLLLAFLAVGIVVSLALTAVRSRHSWRRPHPFVLGFAFASVVLGALFAAEHGVRSARPLPRAHIPDATIDVLIVQTPSLPGPDAATPPPPLPAALRDIEVQFNVALWTPGADRVRLVLSGEAGRTRTLGALSGESERVVSPSWRPGVERAIVLNVDGIPAVPGVELSGSGPDEGPPNWNALLRDILPAPRRKRPPPVFVLLGEADEARLASWQQWAGARGGEAFLFRELGSPTVADAAVKAATVGRARLNEEVLAWRHRPLLFFPRDEEYRPLDVAKAMRDRRVRQCRHDGGGEFCQPVERPSALRSSFDYLVLGPVPGGVEPGIGLESDEATSVYYYRVAGPPELEKTHIDYWWYFTHNPSPVGADSLCTPGLNTPSLTCFEHPSDWEGVTVVLDEDDRLEAVRYAEHEHVISLGAPTLEEVRQKLGPAWLGFPPERPLVFVARDSHASYPLPCPGDCQQLARDVGERPYDGSHPWLNNEDEACVGVCLLPLPLTRSGAPAQWNAFAGRWGAQACILWETFCDVSDPPPAPSHQRRYRNPSATDRWFCVRDGPVRGQTWNFLRRCARPS